LLNRSTIPYMYNIEGRRDAVGYITRLTRNQSVSSSIHNKLNRGSRCSLSKKLHTHCLVLVGLWNGFERDFSIELK